MHSDYNYIRTLIKNIFIILKVNLGEREIKNNANLMTIVNNIHFHLL